MAALFSPDPLAEKLCAVPPQLLSTVILFHFHQGCQLIQAVCAVRICRKHIGKRVRSDNLIGGVKQSVIQFPARTKAVGIHDNPQLQPFRLIKFCHLFIKYRLCKSIICMPDRNNSRFFRIQHTPAFPGAARYCANQRQGQHRYLPCSFPFHSVRLSISIHLCPETPANPCESIDSAGCTGFIGFDGLQLP